MKTLFLRIFLAFWLAMSLIAVVGMGVATVAYTQRLHALDDVSPEPLIAEARQAALARGEDGLQAWRAHQESQHTTLSIFVLDEEGCDVDGRDLPPRLRDWLHTYRGSWPQPLTEEASALGWWSMPQLTVPGGAVYTVVFLPFDSSRLEVMGEAQMPWLLLLLAFAISAPICGLLARYLSRPLLHLQQHTRTIAAGQFDAKVGESFMRRRDEVGVLARDVDRMALRVRQLLASKEELLRNVSHELRSPLARMRVALDLARRRDARMEIQFDRIERECERLDTMVGELLDLAKSRDAQAGSREAVDLAAIVRHVVEDARIEAEPQAGQVRMQAPVTAWIQGDPGALYRLLDNVVRNAVSFNTAGHPIDVVLQAIPCPAPARVNGTAWQITVTDHGPGVAESELPHLFEPFFRCSTPRNTQRAGAGLGLAMAASIVERHGGTITARNRVAEDASSVQGPRSGGHVQDAVCGLIVTITLPVA